MFEGKIKFENENEIKSYIFECEDRFEQMLCEATEKILLINAKIITLCGPTCSGKTTTAHLLMDKLKAKGKNVHIVSFDDFYFDRDDIIKRCRSMGIEVEYESASNLDLPLLKKVMNEIALGEKARVPKYDFSLGTRACYREYTLCEDDVFIFEGIQAFYEEVSSLYCHYRHFSIYICVNTPICYDTNIFDTETIRFLRRIIRDNKHRGTSAEQTSEIWRSVRENEMHNIFPNINKADYVIDSTLAYEINVIMGDASEALKEVSYNSPFYAKAMALKEKFENIELIREEFVPSNSVLQEFIN